MAGQLVSDAELSEEVYSSYDEGSDVENFSQQKNTKSNVSKKVKELQPKKVPQIHTFLFNFTFNLI